MVRHESSAELVDGRKNCGLAAYEAGAERDFATLPAPVIREEAGAGKTELTGDVQSALTLPARVEVCVPVLASHL